MNHLGVAARYTCESEDLMTMTCLYRKSLLQRVQARWTACPPARSKMTQSGEATTCDDSLGWCDNVG